MKFPKHIKTLSHDELQALVSQLQRQIGELTATQQELRGETGQLQRSTKREAVPFSKGTRASKPKRPGRIPGSGTFSFRQAPRPEEIRLASSIGNSKNNLSAGGKTITDLIRWERELVYLSGKMSLGFFGL